MNDQNFTQLEKVLALAESSHEGEALGAVRMARQILAREGLSFGDLARAAGASRSRGFLTRGFFSSSSQTAADTATLKLAQQQLEELESEIQNMQTQVDFWQRRAMDLEQQLSVSLSDSQRWRQLARETVEKLWDVGQATQKEAFGATEDQKGTSGDIQEVIPFARAVGGHN